MRTRIWNIVALKLLVAVSVSKAEICESLLYESDVPLAFDTRAYETITTFPGSLIGTCSDRCLRDPSCLAELNTTCGALEFYDRETAQCVQHDVCNFELTTEPSCFLTETTGDIFDWTRKSGSTSSVSTGPPSAKVGSYYKYTETSSPRLTGDTAWLVSNRVFEDKTYCLSMYYHMYGSTQGTLKIQTITGSDPPSNALGTVW
uniref:MAM domain-containing protein n=1 Tax=Magallana gigas TaxID=29159 RepID=A0A8W8M597_MAGGI